MEGYPVIERWFREYGHDVHHFLVYYTGRTHAEDLVQETYLRALKSYGRFEGRSSPRTWLISIARRVAIDEQRKSKRRRLLPGRLSGEIPSSDRSPEERWIEREDLEDAYRTVMKLKRSYRDVLFLRIMERLSAAETAEALGWTEARVHVTLHRALRKAKILQAEREGGGGS